MTADDPWPLVASQFQHHIKLRVGDQTWQHARNRIAREVLTGKGIHPVPALGPGACEIELTKRSPDQLRSAEKHHDTAAERPNVGPPTLLSYRGREFVIDGHHRINHHLADGRRDDLQVILLTPR